MLRVNRLAAAIDMIAAGTSAPMAIAAKATPTNHDGNIAQEQRRHREVVAVALEAVSEFRHRLHADAIAMKPSSASSPSTSE